jgi:hypothetical protein
MHQAGARMKTTQFRYSLKYIYMYVCVCVCVCVCMYVCMYVLHAFKPYTLNPKPFRYLVLHVFMQLLGFCLAFRAYIFMYYVLVNTLSSPGFLCFFFR